MRQDEKAVERADGLGARHNLAPQVGLEPNNPSVNSRARLPSPLLLPVTISSYPLFSLPLPSSFSFCYPYTPNYDRF